MATNNKYSRTYFIIGLLIGLLLGIYLSLKYIQRKNFPTSVPITIQVYEDSSEAKNLKKIKQKIKIKTSKKENASYDTARIDTLNLSNDMLEKDSSEIVFDNDSSAKVNDSIALNIANNKTDTVENKSDDSLIYKVLKIGEQNHNVNNGDIRIANNELIYAIYVVPQGNRDDFLCNSNQNEKRDSLLVNNIKEADDNGLYVEFWRSPINYTGYKLSKNTLVLFGIYQYTSIMLRYLQNGILELEYLDNKINLKCTDDFISLNLKSNK